MGPDFWRKVPGFVFCSVIEGGFCLAPGNFKDTQTVWITMLCASLALSSVVSSAAFEGAAHEYRDGSTVLEGYVSRPEGSGPFPVVMIVHQWGGLGEYEKRRADMLADMGYLAFALDIYGKGVRPEGAERGATAGRFKGDRALFRQRLTAGFEEAKRLPGAHAGKVAAIGYCFGGTGVLELARTGADVKGVVSFHGGLDSPTPSDGAKIRAQVLVLHGADDPFVPEADLNAFVSEMKTHKVNWEMVSYGNAVHSFTEVEAGTDNSRGAAYNAVADKRSWEAMKRFLAEVFL